MKRKFYLNENDSCFGCFDFIDDDDDRQKANDDMFDSDAFN